MNDRAASGGPPTAAYQRQLNGLLRGLTASQRAVFAAACAERLYTPYPARRDRSGLDDGGLVRAALDLAWEGAIDGLVDDPDPAGLFERCVALIPALESAEHIDDYAEDAIAAAAYALQAAARLDEAAAAWAAQRGIDAIDTLVVTELGWKGGTAAQASEVDRLVWDHPLTRQELRRRHADLASLSEPDLEAAVRAIRVRATGSDVLVLET
jgi:hypothetical protein